MLKINSTVYFPITILYRYYLYRVSTTQGAQGKKKTQGTQGKLREFETYSGNFYEQRK